MSAEQVGVAFAIGYIGDLFHGSQIQPDVRTVQRELQVALAGGGVATDTKVRISSRTDAGVSARMNVAVCELPAPAWKKMGEAGFLRSINDNLDDVVVWAATEVEPGWNSRQAVRRIYRYRLEALRWWPSKVDEEKLQKVLACFEGEHDFTGFCKMEDDRTPMRRIESCRPWRVEGRVVGFEVAGESFLWNQVRRMACSVAAVMTGASELVELEEALANGTTPKSSGLSPPSWLTLWQIEHDGVSFAAPEVDPFKTLSPPKDDMWEREHKMWQATAELEQKLLLLRGWMDSLSR